MKNHKEKSILLSYRAPAPPAKHRLCLHCDENQIEDGFHICKSCTDAGTECSCGCHKRYNINARPKIRIFIEVENGMVSAVYARGPSAEKNIEAIVVDKDRDDGRASVVQEEILSIGEADAVTQDAVSHL